MAEVPRTLNWFDDERLACPRANLLAVFDDRSQTLESTPDEFILVKSRGMIDWYEASFAGDPPKRVLEIGIFKGGSVVLFSETLAPRTPRGSRYRSRADSSPGRVHSSP